MERFLFYSLESILIAYYEIIFVKFLVPKDLIIYFISPFKYRFVRVFLFRFLLVFLLFFYFVLGFRLGDFGFFGVVHQ
jgi:hypothetical protein